MTTQPVVKHFKKPTRAIAEFCLWCVGGSPEERKKCVSEDTCPLWHYRLGHNPYRQPHTEAQRAASRRSMARLRRQTDEG